MKPMWVARRNDRWWPNSMPHEMRARLPRFISKFAAK
jgi:hypothetical protein